jgi:uncharacterized protein (TIGR02466 family)
MSLINLFPTPIVHIEVQPRAKLLSWAKNFSEQAAHDPNSSSAGWHSQYDLHTLPEFAEHWQSIWEDVIYGCCQLIDDRHEVLPASMWLNKNKPGDYNLSHKHYNVDLSGVLWLETPPNCGRIVFENEQDITRYNLIEKVDPDYQNASSFHHTVWFEPVAWNMIIFPADLRHSVERNRSDQDRLSLGFNLKVV